MNCKQCGDTVAAARWAIGRHTCMPCGEAAAKQERKGWTVCPMPKSNYILITDLSLLKGLNTSHKGGATT